MQVDSGNFPKRKDELMTGNDGMWWIHDMTRNESMEGKRGDEVEVSGNGRREIWGRERREKDQRLRRRDYVGEIMKYGGGERRDEERRGED